MTDQGHQHRSATRRAAPHAAVRSRGLTKGYQAATGRRGLAAALGRPPELDGAHLALEDVDLDVRRGQSLGIIGPNGAGKSTFLKIVAKITGASRGSVEVDGSVLSVIELGPGFHPDLTGAENVRCLGVLHGRTLRQIDAALDGILEFAGLGEAADLPLKQYSLGMRARLAFAVVTDQRPDVLAVDEVLAVGDQEFQARCFERILGMIRAGTTLVFVSHEMPMVATVCDRVIQLRLGQVVDDGTSNEVIERYLSRSAAGMAGADASHVTIVGSGVEAGVPTAESLRLWVDIDVEEPVLHPSIGLDIVLPMVNPQNVVSSSTEMLAPFVSPGRYRITGTTDSVWGAGLNMRFTMSVIDRQRHRVLDAASVDADVVGDISGHQLGPVGAVMTPPLAWELHREEPSSGEATAVAHRGTSTAGKGLVAVRDLSKHYRARTHGATIRPALPGRFGELRHRDVVALDQLTIDIGRGESVGLIGPNASGKTTLLRVIAGVTRPDSGSVAVHGTTVSLLELGAGFHADLTGLENLQVLGRLMGVGPSVLDGYVEEAIAFADLREVIDHRLRTYSTGMRARLGLAMALVCPADLILIDEVLAVGDEEFRRQAIDCIHDRVADGLTVIFVSHDLQLVEQMCERVIRLDHGRCVEDGPTDAVLQGYAGSSWAGGVHDAEGGVRLQRLAVDRHRIPTGATLHIDGRFVVDEPVPDARLEFALRAPMWDRTATLTIDERAAVSVMMKTLVPPGQELNQPGSYRFHCSLEAEHLVGEVDIVLSAVDVDRQVVLSEVWEQVVIGSPAPSDDVTFEPGLSWSTERLPEAAPQPGGTL